MYSPYQVDSLNRLETLGILVSMLILYLGIWTLTVSADVQKILTVLIFLMNGVWILSILAIVSKSYMNTLTKFTDKFLSHCMPSFITSTSRKSTHQASLIRMKQSNSINDHSRGADLIEMTDARISLEGYGIVNPLIVAPGTNYSSANSRSKSLKKNNPHL